MYTNNGAGMPTREPTLMPTVKSAEDFRGNLTQYVLSKYSQHMDPILCDESAKKCWLRVGGTFDDNQKLSQGGDDHGATLFPIIQSTDARCLKCGRWASKVSSKEQKT